MASKNYTERHPQKLRGKDHSGIRYGRWVVKSFSHRRNADYYWTATCSCGKEKLVLIHSLVSGRSLSCGCVGKEKMTTHGMSMTREYGVWGGMLSRCSDASNKDYPNYGGRGVSVCKEWMKSFDNFYRDMGERPTKSHSIDRINNSKGYSKENCRWATRLEQSRNRRNSVFLTLGGVTKHLGEWSKDVGIPPKRIYQRIRAGWSVHDAIMTPTGKDRRTNPSSKDQI